MKDIKKFIYLLSLNDQRGIKFLLILLIISAFLDMAGIASILPFMMVLSDLSLLKTNFLLNFLYEKSKLFGVKNEVDFLFILGLLVFVLLVISLSFKAYETYFRTRFIQNLGYSISKRLMERYLFQPYHWFLNRHSSDFGKIILSETDFIIASGFSRILEIIARGMIVIVIIILLLFVDMQLTFITFSFLGISYLIIFFFIRKYLNKIGAKRLKNNQTRFATVGEAFGAIKTIKVGSLEHAYINEFSIAARIFAKTTASATAISLLPRFFLEAVAFGGILLIMLIFVSKNGSFVEILPVASLYIFAGYRLLPSLQVIYSSIAQLTFVRPSLDKLYNDVKNIKKSNEKIDNNILTLNKSIRLKNISFKYPETQRLAIDNVSLSIFSGSKVGFVGSTGSGKTTIIDLILGLLQPQKGNLIIDKTVISSQNFRSWQRSIGYVPQQIYLSDNTIASNIAFGLETKDINMDQVEKVSKIANLHEFVISELPNKYLTTIGERGIRLSGGQLQRIGIARALYHDPKVLIFDEATSALDNLTEKAVMDTINNLNKDITIILIAHRLDTLKDCDNIFVMEKGKLIGEGTFEELSKTNKIFSIYSDKK